MTQAPAIYLSGQHRAGTRSEGYVAASTGLLSTHRVTQSGALCDSCAVAHAVCLFCGSSGVTDVARCRGELSLQLSVVTL